MVFNVVPSQLLSTKKEALSLDLHSKVSRICVCFDGSSGDKRNLECALVAIAQVKIRLCSNSLRRRIKHTNTRSFFLSVILFIILLDSVPNLVINFDDQLLLF